MCCTRQEAKMLVYYVYVQNIDKLFDSPNFWCVHMTLSPLFKLHMGLQVAKLLSMLFICYLVVLPVFSCAYLVIFLSQLIFSQQLTLGKYYTPPPKSASIM